MNSLGGIRRARKSPAIHRRPPSANENLPATCGQWRLTRRLPSGGTLAVFRVSTLNELGPGCYVLKTPNRVRPHNGLARALLCRAATVAADVTHPQLISTVARNLGTPQPHIVSPYLEGITLRRLLDAAAEAATGPPIHLPVSMVLSIARQVAVALAALHRADWLHAQLRPGHLIVSPQGRATLIDLTQARRLESSECDVRDSTPRAPLYAAPETFLSRGRLTAAADIYSLGVVLYETLTGRPPFASAAAERLGICHQSVAPPDLRQLRPDASLEVAELVRRMLAKEPLRRPTAEQLVRWLAELEIEELAT
jgi:serine/threonine protein kinase